MGVFDRLLDTRFIISYVWEGAPEIQVAARAVPLKSHLCESRTHVGCGSLGWPLAVPLRRRSASSHASGINNQLQQWLRRMQQLLHGGFRGALADDRAGGASKFVSLLASQHL
jgi:hypothetical protein